MVRLCSLLAAVTVVSVAPASAFAMRCGTHLIERGDTRLELLARCGEPTDISRSVEEHTIAFRGDNQAVARTVRAIRLGDERMRVRSRWGEPADRSVHSETRSAAYSDEESVEVARTTVEVETWTYNFGPTRFMRRVSFENGRVVRVETLRPGF